MFVRLVTLGADSPGPEGASRTAPRGRRQGGLLILILILIAAAILDR